jgi:disulfide oxidoreductase YuzD
MPSSQSFEAFRANLARRLQQAKSVGASRGTILNAAKDVAEWLNAEVEPGNPEQRLLKELWDVSDDRERHSLTNVLVKFIDRTPTS